MMVLTPEISVALSTPLATHKPSKFTESVGGADKVPQIPVGMTNKVITVWNKHE